MIIKSIIIKNGLYERIIEFDDKNNLIYSEKNSCGKTTLIRLLLYSLGYSIPSTKKLKFSKCHVETKLELDNNTTMTLIRNSEDIIVAICDDIETIYVLPEQLNELHKLIYNTDNKTVLDNLLGTFYFDQEKGWTLLNRGKVIGNIRFNIDDLVRGLGEKDCTQLIAEEKKLSSELSKYQQIFSFSQYKDTISEDSLAGEPFNDEITVRINQLEIKQNSIQREIRRLNQSISGNKKFKEFVSDMKLLIQTDEGDLITVTQDNIVGLNDAVELLMTKKKMLTMELAKVVSDIEKLTDIVDKEDEQLSFWESESLADAFDKRIITIPINQVAIKNRISELKQQLKELRKEIEKVSRSDNLIVKSLFNNFTKYAVELGLGAPHDFSSNYMFTSNLKELSGAVLHKTVFAFKLAYILEAERYLNIKLPIILDSPSGKEVDQENIEKMMDILKRDFKGNQIIIASIYSYSFPELKKIVLRERLLNETLL